MRDIVILGAGGHAREIAFLIGQINEQEPLWNLLGFVEAGSTRVGVSIGKYKICCGEDDLLNMHVDVAIGIGSPPTIRKVTEKLCSFPNLHFPNLIHPKVIWETDRVRLGAGNLVCAGNNLTTDIQIGSFNVLNRSCTVGHDAQIGNCCVINPGVIISGGVVIGDGCIIGAGAIILQYLTIGETATVGAGAVVTKNVEAGKTVAGVPAKMLGIRR